MRLNRILVPLLALFATSGQSEPYVPDTETVVLERLPAGNATRQLDPLRRQMKDEPRNVRIAVQLAQGYLQIGRETSDPRFVSYAQATLSPWMQEENPPAAVLVLSATALQSSHRFDEALALLDRALAIDPRNAQAWLTKATLLQVQGNFPAARAACRRLLLADQLIALTCMTSVDSLNGRLEPGYRALANAAAGIDGVDPSLQSWVLGQLAEMAMRLGDFAAAEKHFLAAQRASPEDVWLKGAYADLLLLMARDSEVIELLKRRESQDILLLRLAIAGKRLGAADALRWAQMFDARRRATRLDDNSHLREHARFLLEVRNAPVEALRVAQENWRVQREPADVRVYLQSALHAREPQAAAAVNAWVRETGYEDRTLDDSARAVADRSR